MYPEPTELLLIACLTESIWIQKIQIKYVDTKHQVADILTKGNFTRDEWNYLLHFFKHQPVQLDLLLSEFQLAQLHGNDGEEDARKGRRRKDCGKVKADDELGFICPLQMLRLCRLRLRQSLEILKAPSQNDWTSSGRPGAREFNLDAASSSLAW